MAEANDKKNRNQEELSRAARRKFLRQSLAVTSGVALSGMLPSSLLEASSQAGQTCPGPAFAAVGEIKSRNGKLQAVLKVVSGKRNIPGPSGAATQSMLRYFEGYDPSSPNQKLIDPAAAGPGPTLRCELGDAVNITLLNQVKVQDFGGSLDAGEEGRGNGCDQATKVNANGMIDKNWYPANDKFPDCLHGSSSANIHYHGTHVTPATTGDNVLVNVRPDPKVKESDVQQWFNEVFQHCEMGHQPKKWEDMPKGWREYQEGLVKNYDKTAPYVGPGANPNGHGLPAGMQLWPQNQAAIDQGLWPQWYVGSYPNCFQIPKYDPVNNPDLRMGQAPGTHWYHSHKHGSTAINLFNGLGGAMIIMDNSPNGYDGKLQAFYRGKLEEKVFVIQHITSAMNLLSANEKNQPLALLVNGQIAPTITMQPGQVQLWRLLNASAQGFFLFKFDEAVKFKQTAQDGVQYAWENYNDPANGTQQFMMSPANRIDVLVQAPMSKGCYALSNVWAKSTLAYINVTGDPVNPAMGFPTQQSDYPPMPEFLKDIDPDSINYWRRITYSSTQEPQPTDGTRKLPQFKIDGRQFEDQRVNQVMLLDTAEEWTLVNADAITQTAHPFHIHINPVQIVEVFDPSVPGGPQRLKPPYIWWDTMQIPAPAQVDGKWVNGYLKFRSRFVDFTGQYVQHCHILEHEDRGMMQLLEVVSNRTILKHH